MTETTTTDRLAKGTKVRYQLHTRASRGGGIFVRPSTGTVIGYYGELYVIRSRYGVTTREYPQAITEVLSA